MGDTGSLALGGALAGFAVITRTELLLALLGGLFVIQTLSVILQVGFFKLTKGKRLFRMAPLHHHFELLGWEEITVVIRFWIIAGLFVAAGLGVFYAEWVAAGDLVPSTTPSAAPRTGPGSARSSPGFGVSGFAAADNLTFLGARVTALGRVRRRRPRRSGRACWRPSAPPSGSAGRHRGPARRRRRGGHLAGLAPGAPLLAQAAARGVPVWGEVELAWRLRDPERPAPWLAITGTNGKTTTVQMLEAMLRAAGLRTVAAGNVGLPIVEAVMDPDPYDVLAVELSSFQLHYTSSMRRDSAAVLNVAEDHLDWYDSDLARLRRRQGPDLPAASSGPASTTSPTRSPSSWSATPTCRRAPGRSASPSARRASACSASSTTCSATGRSSRSGRPRRRAVHPRRPGHRRHRTTSPTRWPRPRSPARTASRPRRCATALRGFRPDGHRIAEVGTFDEVTWVDDSKATNPPAALASLQAYDPVVWIAGGLAKGARFDDLVQRVRDRLRGVVLIGAMLQ